MDTVVETKSVTSIKEMNPGDTIVGELDSIGVEELSLALEIASEARDKDLNFEPIEIVLGPIAANMAMAAWAASYHYGKREGKRPPESSFSIYETTANSFGAVYLSNSASSTKDPKTKLPSDQRILKGHIVN